MKKRSLSNVTLSSYVSGILLTATAVSKVAYWASHLSSGKWWINVLIAREGYFESLEFEPQTCCDWGEHQGLYNSQLLSSGCMCFLSSLRGSIWCYEGLKAASEGTVLKDNIHLQNNYCNLPKLCAGIYNSQSNPLEITNKSYNSNVIPYCCEPLYQYSLSPSSSIQAPDFALALVQVQCCLLRGYLNICFTFAWHGQC